MINNKPTEIMHNEIIAWAGQVLAQPIISTELIVETHWSRVLKINTPEGCVYLKQTPPDLFIEVGVIEVLGEIGKVRAVPEIIASNKKLNCFLMKDAGRKIREILKQAFDADLFCKAIDKFTALQLAAAHHVDVLMKIGVPDWRLEKMPDLYRQLLLQKDLLIEDGLSEIELSELKALELTVTHLCEKLSSYGIKQTIVQPDFNDNNTVIDEKTQAITVVDLGEIAISHPFFSLLNGLFVIKKHHGLTENDARFLKIKDACFRNYRAFYSNKNLEDAFATAQLLSSIYAALAQYRFMLACGKDNIMSFQRGRLSGVLKEFMVMDSMIDKIKSLFCKRLHVKHVRVFLLDASYDNMNIVFNVVSCRGRCLVKIPKKLDSPNDILLKGLHVLFDLDKTFLQICCRHIAVSDFVNKEGGIKTPKMFSVSTTSNNVFGRPFVILEKMPGVPIPQGSDLEQKVMQEDEHFAFQLGEHMGRLHLKPMNYFGDFIGKKSDLKLWPKKLQTAMSVLGKSRKALLDPGVQKMLPYYLDAASKLKTPQICSLIMLDCWPCQFLADKNKDKFSACIDIESYVVGPVALELVLLELWLGSLSKFKEGYFSVNPVWPEEIEDAREVYRFFLFLLYDCPEQGLDACINSNAKFPQADRVRVRLAAPILRYPGLK